MEGVELTLRSRASNSGFVKNQAKRNTSKPHLEQDKSLRGKVLTRSSATPKELWREVWPGQSLELLKELHLVARDGSLQADSRRKLKQVLHLVQQIRPWIEESLSESGASVVAAQQPERPKRGRGPK
jgi:hypothetical protein